MKQLVFLCCILSSITLGAQQYTYLYFEDKNGLRDSIEIAVGLTEEEIDAIPTYTLQQTIQAMKDSARWVWIHPTLGLDDKYGSIYSYVPYDGPIWNGCRYIYFPADRLPVTIRWDKQFFIDTELTPSFLSDAAGWDDVGLNTDLGEEIYAMRLKDNDECVLHYTYTSINWPYDKFDDVIVRMIRIYIGTQSNLEQDVKTVRDALSPARKLLHNGQLIIERNGRTFTVTGTEIK